MLYEVITDPVVLLLLGLGSLNDLRKGLRVRNGQLGQNLTIETHFGLFQAMYQATVGHAVVTGSGIDPRDPQGPEITLFDATVTKSVVKGAIDRFRCTAEQFAARATVPLGQFKNLVSYNFV